MTGTLNFGTYLYNKGVFDWIKTIPGIETVIEVPEYVHAIGIIEFADNDKGDFCIGVFISFNVLLAQARHFKGRTATKVHAKKSGAKNDYSYSIALGQGTSYEVWRVDKTANSGIVRIEVRWL